LSQLATLLVRCFRNTQRAFHMLVGLAFLILAVAGAAVCLSEWTDYRQAPERGLLGFGLVAGFTVLLIVCGLYSFVKARSVR
jgi:hypothetical protein